VHCGLRRLVVAVLVGVLSCQSSLAQNVQQPPKQPLGRELFNQVQAELNAERAAAAALEKVFEGFPANCWRAEMFGGKPTIVRKDPERATVAVSCGITPDRKAYDRFVKRAEPILKKLAKETATVSLRFRADSNVPGFRFGLMPPAFGQASTVPPNVQPGDCVLVLDRSPAFSERAIWKCYYFDKSLEDSLEAVAGRRVAPRIRLLDANNKPLAVDQSEIGSGPYDGLRCVASLTRVAVNDGETTARRTVFFVSPVLFVSRTRGEDKPFSLGNLTFNFPRVGASLPTDERIRLVVTGGRTDQRTFSLSLDELKALDRVQCDVVPVAE
jgi:hypothetical protein